MLLLYLKKEAGPCRIGVVVSKATGGAVVRNAWKRMVREKFRKGRKHLDQFGDHVVIIKRGTKGRPGDEAQAELLGLFNRVSQKKKSRRKGA